jgi:hypothetical protein
MSKLITSNEFGDWLIGEIAQAREQVMSVNPDVALAARLRLETLKTAKKSLLEFLKMQQKMFDAASAARRKNQGAVPAREPSNTPRLKSRRGRPSDPSNASTQTLGANGA